MNLLVGKLVLLGRSGQLAQETFSGHGSSIWIVRSIWPGGAVSGQSVDKTWSCGVHSVDALRRILNYCERHPSRTRTHGTSIQTGHRIRAVRGVSVCWKSVSNSTPKQRVFWRWIIWPLSSIRSTSGLDYVYFANAPITFAAGILTLVVTELIAELIKMNGWQFYSVDFYVRRGPKVNWLIALLFLLNLTFSINSIAQFSDLVQSPRMFDWLMLEILISGHLIVNRDDKRR